MLRTEALNINAEGWPTPYASHFEGDTVILKWRDAEWIIFVGKVWRKEQL